MFQTLMIGLSLLLISLLLLRRFKRTNLNLPPSPPKLPIIGNLHQLGSLPYRSLRDLSNKYGPLMLIHLGQIPTLIVSSHEMAQEIMRTHDITFASRSPLKVASHVYSGNDGVVFAPYGEHWRQAKKLCVTHLLSVKMVQSFRSVKENEVELMIEKISRSSSLLGRVDMSETLNWYSSNVVSSAVSDKISREEEKKDVMRLLAKENVEVLGQFNIGDFSPIIGWMDFLMHLTKRSKMIGKKWDNIFDEVISEHTKMSSKDDAEHKNTNFIDVMLSLENDSTNDFSFSRESIKAILIDMFAAGVDTTHTVLEWTMAELVRNPTMMKRLQDEVRGVGGGRSLIKDEDLHEMSYLKAVIRETMRLHMPGPFLFRQGLSQSGHHIPGYHKVGGYHIPGNTRVIINAWAIARDPKVWEEPEKFNPDRFMGGRIDIRGNDFEYLPFGAGRRICPGINFAMQTVELGIANLVNRFDWELPGNMTPDDLDMSDAFGIVVHMKQPLELTAKPFTSQ